MKWCCQDLPQPRHIWKVTVVKDAASQNASGRPFVARHDHDRPLLCIDSRTPVPPDVIALVEPAEEIVGKVYVGLVDPLSISTTVLVSLAKARPRAQPNVVGRIELRSVRFCLLS